MNKNSKTLNFVDEDCMKYPEWEEKKLGEISKITTGKLDSNAQVEDGQYRFYTCAKEYLMIDKYSFDTEALLVSGNGAYVGYIHYYNGKFNAYQRTYVIQIYDASTLYVQFFLEQFLAKRIDKDKNAGSMPYIVMDTLSLMQISLPSLPEQEKIAEFFSALDERIELQSQKINLLKEQKKGYLQQVFSRELVFTDDNGNEYPEWEEKKLGEIIESGKSGGTPTASNKSYYSGSNANIPFLGISDMTEQGKYLSKTSKHITKGGLDASSAWVVPAGYLVYAMYASVGKVGILANEAATSQAMFCMNFKDDALLEYVYYFLGHFRDNGQLNSLITTGTQGNINAKTLKSISIPIPSLPEQEKIAEFFSALDENIELNEDKLTLLKEQKKGYLQGIFGT